MQKVRAERTGWRDEELSKRHRRWGWDCPAIDLDFLLIEYDRGVAVALVEYKNENASVQYVSHPSYQALIDLGNKSGLPVFGVRYATDFSWWIVNPLNSIAKSSLSQKKTMDEKDFVSFLYKLRGIQITQSVLDGIDIPI